MLRNTVTVEINGEKIGFKCGTLAIGIACRESGSENVTEFMNKLLKGDLVASLALYYGSACQYSGRKDITMDMVSDWLEEMGEEQASKVTNILLESFKPKNLQAPQAGATPTQ